MMISVGLDLNTAVVPQADLPTGIVSIVEFSRDMTLFDSGAHLGLNRADIPLSGTGTPGVFLQARARSVDDAGVSSTFWEDIGEVAVDGTWQATIAVPRNASWYRAEVRLKNQSATIASPGNRFGVGHVWSHWSQSDYYHVIAYQNSSHATPEAVLDDSALQIVRLLRAETDPAQPANSAEVLHITNSSPVTNGLARMANTLAQLRPNEKFAIAMHSLSGTGFFNTVDEADGERWWADERQIHDLLTADGTKVAMNWHYFSSGTTATTEAAETMGPALFGLNPDGTAFTAPGTVTSGAVTEGVDHLFTELYNPAYTKFGFVGYNSALIEDLKTGLGENAVYNSFLLPTPDGITPRSFLKGYYDSGADTWLDTSHANKTGYDGAARLGSMLAYSGLAQTGMITGGFPDLDTIEWHPLGNTTAVAISSSMGPLTTLRRLRGEPRLSGPPLKYDGDARGFFANGTALYRAEIRDAAGNLADQGDVWLFKNDGSNWTYADSIEYRDETAWEANINPGDWTNGYQYKDSLGVADPVIEMVPVNVLTPTGAFANTLPAPNAFNTAATGPWFADSTAYGTTQRKLFARAIGKYTDIAAAQTIFALDGLKVKLEFLKIGEVRLTLKDSTNVAVFSGGSIYKQSSMALTFGSLFDIAVSIDLTAGYAKVWVDGTLAIDQSFTSPAGDLDNRKPVFLSASPGSASGQAVGSFETLTLWKDATSDGSDPLSTPYKTISGTVAEVNADAWRKGDAAT